MYPSFFKYMLLDWTASLVLFYVACHHSAFYDILWRITQLLLLAGRFTLVMEAYRRMVPQASQWLFSDALTFPMAAFAVVLLNTFTPCALVWPGSGLEGIFSLMGAGNAFLGFLLCGFLSAPREVISAERLMNSYHARILCAYLLLTAPCYYAASRHIDSIGSALMIVAVICYSTWFLCMWIDRRSTPDGSGAY